MTLTIRLTMSYSFSVSVLKLNYVELEMLLTSVGCGINSGQVFNAIAEASKFLANALRAEHRDG